VLQHAQIGNVTSSSVCIGWDVTEAATPALQVFADAGATHDVTNQVRIEMLPLDHSRREVSTSYAARQNNRALQTQMAAKRLGLARVSGLAPYTQYFLRPVALNAVGVQLASGPLQPVTTARTTAFVVESRQLVVDMAALVPTTGDVGGALLILSQAASAYPLIAVVGDASSPTLAYFDLAGLLNAAGESTLLPAAGTLDLTLSWLGLPSRPGYFSPSVVTYTGAPQAALATQSSFVGESFVLHVVARDSNAVAGMPFYLDLSVTDVAGVPATSFNSPLVIECPTSPAGSGTTPPLVAGRLAAHPLIFATPGVYTVTLRDLAASTSVSLDVRVLPMNYQNWRAYHFGSTLAGSAPGDDPDHDGNSNLAEYVLGGDPNSSSGSLVSSAPPGASALRLRFNLNPLQTEYAVVIQVAPNFVAWSPSAKVPTLVEAHADYNLMEVAWTQAELQAETGVVSPAYFARLLLEPATNYNSWAAAHGLVGAAAAPTANPDFDGNPNFVEFALDSDPASGVGSGKIRHALVPTGSTFAQVLTIPMRVGASPSPVDPSGGELMYDVEGIRYHIEATANLINWGLDMQEVSVDASSLPELSAGYEYRSFRAPIGYALEFLRARIELLAP
ncbi:MAG: hypothetical protein WCJ66_12850, partial [Verrucomicrobiota bacterium]